MTLFEAIRELKEGQQIRRHPGGERFAYWAWGTGRAFFADDISWNEWDTDARIVDLPKPKMRLEEGLYEAAEAIPYDLLENPSPLQFTKHFIGILRSLPIDWQAEAGRKDNLK